MIRPNAPSRDELAGVMADPVNFIGRKALSGFEQVLQDEAERLAKKGAKPQEILRDTGMFMQRGKPTQGMDAIPNSSSPEIWKTEIPGSTLSFKPGKIDEVFNKRFGDTGSFSDKLGDMVNYDALFAAYPDLADVPVQYNLAPGLMKPSGHYNELWDPGSGATAKYPNRMGDPAIFAKISNRDQLKEILLHEIQHGIQRREGWPYGGSDALPGMADVAKRVQAASRPALSFLTDVQDQEIGDIIKSLQMDALDPDMAYGLAEQQWMRDPANQWHQKMMAGHNAILNPPANWDPAYQGYRFLEGENEATNAAYRGAIMGLPLDELRSTHPEMTAQFPSSVTWRR